MLTTPSYSLSDQVYPVILNPRNRDDQEKIVDLKNNPQIQVINQINSQVGDLIKSRHPAKTFSKE
ncbi:MAG: hypothetical protein CL555_01040 [Algoriphagus sp.]|nr:hypothetical protein [Algoriphagus sp.]